MKLIKWKRKSKATNIQPFEIQTPKGEIQYIDKEKNIEFYATRAHEHICDCATCKIYYKEVKDRMPELDQYLSDMGVEITLPFEAPSYGIQVDKEYEEYFAWYIVYGKCDIDYTRKLGNLTIFAQSIHPKTGIEKEHFVLEVDNIVFKE